MRNMSFSMTTEQIRNRTKTVTRRLGWKFLKPGDCVRAVKKAMGLKKGEKVEELAYLKIVDVRREWLYRSFQSSSPIDETAKEGFPEMSKYDFLRFFCEHMKCSPTTEITRIEFLYCIGAGKPQRAVCLCEK